MSIREERKRQSRQALLDAALSFSMAGQAFSSTSLREITKSAGLVPTAFYRHFQDMEQLGLELVDQASLHIKQIEYQMGQIFQHQPDMRVETSLRLLFQKVSLNPEPWVFLIAERWGGSSALRTAIQREIEYMIDDLSADLGRTEKLSQLKDAQDVLVLSQMLINMALNWVMQWLNLQRSVPAEQLEQMQEQLVQQAIGQVKLLLRGLLPKEA